MTGDRQPALVPVTVYLKGPTFLAYETAADQRGTSIGTLLSLQADRAVAGKPQKRKWVRVTSEMKFRIAEMHRLGYGPGAIARDVGCSVASVCNHLPKADQS